ncbi:hypothetical protein PoB_007226900 [Plakobranchus ocellatus]|uniref:Uncharacterized protein n=1 Tax=Plakobranchus ocellatus TaxID=259542 RepID=A0AAV4DP29_9GAST|nr:hypothetical protein PoB_007226900 [Plakobranchus ocellatus]
MTSEQAINKHAKTSGGIVAFSRSQPTYYTWCVTRHIRAQYVSATYQMANIESKKCVTHKESSLSKRKLSVKKIMDTFSAFLNPFNTERKHFACISSGQKVPEDIADDLLKVEDVGKKSFKEFVDTRLKDKTTRFHGPLTKTKLKTVGSVSKSTQIKSAKNVAKIKAKRNIFGQLLVLSQEYQIDMENVLKDQQSNTSTQA